MFALNYINKHSTIFMVVACFMGFALPDAAQVLLPHLPQALFFLMVFTLLGIHQPALLRILSRRDVWQYAVLHLLGMTLLCVGLAFVAGIRGDLLLALAVTMATGALFSAPAIVRSMGVLPLYSMALTIATTLLMPLALLLNLWVFQTTAVHLDWWLYGQRLLIFIASPMLLATLAHRWFGEAQLHRVHQQLSKVTIVLVILFPFSLIGGYRRMFDQQPMHALFLLLVAAVLCFGLFALNFWLYRKQTLEHAISAAVASGGRNVLLTYTIAAPFVGSEFMSLVGAIQLPTYLLPLLAQWWMRRVRQHEND